MVRSEDEKRGPGFHPRQPCSELAWSGPQRDANCELIVMLSVLTGILFVAKAVKT